MEEELLLIKKMAKNDKVLRDTYKMLQKVYGNEYVAIDNGKVILHDHTFDALIKALESSGKDFTTTLVQFIPEKGVEVLF